MQKIKKLIKIYKTSPLLSSVVFFVLLVLMFSFVYFSAKGVSVIDDHFFHYKYSKLLRTEGSGIKDNFDWIKFSRYGSEKESFNTSLFHHVSKPFTLFEDDLTGLRVMDIFWGALILSLVFYFMRIVKAPYAPLWILLALTVHSIFTWSLCGRNYLVVLPLMLFEILFAVQRKKKMLFAVSVLHVLFHLSTFYFPLFLVFITEIARYFQTKKVYLKNFAIVLASTIIGMAFYPNFPKNIFNLGKTIISIHTDILTEKIPSHIEGSELLKVSWTMFYERANILVLVFLVSLGVVTYFFYHQNRKRKPKENEQMTTLIALSIFTTFSLASSLLYSGRFIIFFYIGVIALGSMSLKSLLEKKELEFGLNYKKYLIFPITIFLMFSVYHSSQVFNERADKPKQDIFGEAAEWIAERSKKGDVVFIDNWSFFPMLFFYNHKNSYTMGLEPRELFEHDEELFWKWYNIRFNQFLCGEAKDCKEERSSEFKKISSIEKRDEFERTAAELIVKTIRNDFGSRFIFSHDVRLNRIFYKNKDLFIDSAQITSKEKDSNFVRVFQLD